MSESVCRCPSILGELLLPPGRYYWETIVSRSTAYRLGVLTSTGSRSSPLGENSLSWCLQCVPTISGCVFIQFHATHQQLGLNKGCQNPGLEGHNPTGFSDLPGKHLFPTCRGESRFCLGRQKTRLDCGPRELGSKFIFLYCFSSFPQLQVSVAARQHSVQPLCDRDARASGYSSRFPARSPVLLQRPKWSAVRCFQPAICSAMPPCPGPGDAGQPGGQHGPGDARLCEEQLALLSASQQCKQFKLDIFIIMRSIVEKTWDYLWG